MKLDEKYLVEKKKARTGMAGRGSTSPFSSVSLKETASTTSEHKIGSFHSNLLVSKGDTEEKQRKLQQKWRENEEGFGGIRVLEGEK